VPVIVAGDDPVHARDAEEPDDLAGNGDGAIEFCCAAVW
jgi:hypothetical protein